ncbi:MAG: hypothetical protein H6656_02905 [Ardenticatenaceae bacterium]|nr:hypothetical protein [Ardenticatenaceae bacterium]
MTEAELAELISLSNLVEEIHVERLAALIELAALRNISLESLKKFPQPSFLTNNSHVTSTCGSETGRH